MNRSFYVLPDSKTAIVFDEIGISRSIEYTDSTKEFLEVENEIEAIEVTKNLMNAQTLEKTTNGKYCIKSKRKSSKFKKISPATEFLASIAFGYLSYIFLEKMSGWFLISTFLSGTLLTKVIFDIVEIKVAKELNKDIEINMEFLNQKLNNLREELLMLKEIKTISKVPNEEAIDLQQYTVDDVINYFSQNGNYLSNR